MWNAPRTVVVGVYGYTGALVAASLTRAGIPFTGAGRDPERTRELMSAVAPGAPHAAVDIQHPDEVEELLDQFNVVINCVGPFSVFSRGLVEAVARRRGMLYIDVCGEQEFVRNARERWHERCTANETVLVHACAFESAFADVLSREICVPGHRYQDISSYYIGTLTHRVSPGTLLTLRLLPLLRTERWVDSAWQADTPGRPGRALVIDTPPISGRAVFAPYPEIQFFVEAFSPRNACSHYLVEEEEARFVSMRSGKRDKSVEEILDRHRRRAHTGPDEEERRHQPFQTLVQATDDDSITRSALVSGNDTYGATAEAVRVVFEHVVSSGANPGVTGPGNVIPPRKFLTRMAEAHGVEWAVF